MLNRFRPPVYDSRVIHFTVNLQGESSYDIERGVWCDGPWFGEVPELNLVAEGQSKAEVAHLLSLGVARWLERQARKVRRDLPNMLAAPTEQTEPPASG